jgi:hypothetical protein
VDDQLLALARSQTIAAWVQAVGSILAIAFAGVLIIVQHRLERQRATEDAKAAHSQRVNALIAFIKATADQAHSIKRTIRGRQFTKNVEISALMSHAHRAVSSFRELTARFDVAAIDDPDVWSNWANFVAELYRSEAYCPKYEAQAIEAEKAEMGLQTWMIQTLDEGMDLVIQCAEFAAGALRANLKRSDL